MAFGVGVKDIIASFFCFVFVAVDIWFWPVVTTVLEVCYVAVYNFQLCVITLILVSVWDPCYVYLPFRE